VIFSRFSTLSLKLESDRENRLVCFKSFLTIFYLMREYDCKYLSEVLDRNGSRGSYSDHVKHVNLVKISDSQLLRPKLLRPARRLESVRRASQGVLPTVLMKKVAVEVGKKK